MLSQQSAKTFRACDLIKKLVDNPAPVPNLTNIKFGKIFSPHMLTVDFNQGLWSTPRIEPLQPLTLPPHAACLHYGLQCYEGLKVYADIDDIHKVEKGESLGGHHRLRLFRPERNIERFQRSMARLCFPSFDASEFLTLLIEFAKVERDYVPKKLGYSLYLRPTALGIGDGLGASPAESGRVFVFASVVGSYYQKTPESSQRVLQPVRLLVDEVNKRAWPGGLGAFKIGGNYAGPMLVQKEAAKQGFSQVLWLGPNREVTEVGAMNFFMFWRTPENKLELVTSPLDGLTLPGVTRDTILNLVREWGEFSVSERTFTIDDVITAFEENRVLECLGSGTAALVVPVDGLHYRGKDYIIPSRNEEQSLASRIYDKIIDIQYGRISSEWSLLIDA